MKAIFVGPEKTGSSWIDRLLRWRGDVELPADVKETYFFDRHYDKGVAWFKSHYRAELEAAVEVAPSYFKEPLVPARIYQHFPDAHIIITVREPVARTLSMYQHLVANGWTTASFADALANDSRLLRGSMYAAGAAPWIEQFGQEQVHFLQFEQLHRSPQAFADRIAAILDVPPQVVPETILRSVENARRSGRSALLSKISRRAIYAIRSIGGYRLISWLKRIGLGRLIWKSESKGCTLSTEDRAQLNELLAPDLARLQAEHKIRFEATAPTDQERQLSETDIQLGHHETP